MVQGLGRAEVMSVQALRAISQGLPRHCSPWARIGAALGVNEPITCRGGGDVPMEGNSHI